MRFVSMWKYWKYVRLKYDADILEFNPQFDRTMGVISLGGAINLELGQIQPKLPHNSG